MVANSLYGTLIRSYKLIQFFAPCHLDPPLPPPRGQRWVTRKQKIFAALALICFIFVTAIVSFNLLQHFNHSTIPTPPHHSQCLPDSLVQYQNYLKEYYSDPYPLYSKSVFAAIHPDQPLAPVLVCIDNNETDWSIYHQRWMSFHGNVDRYSKVERSCYQMNEIGSLNGGKKAANGFAICNDRGHGPAMGKSTCMLAVV